MKTNPITLPESFIIDCKMGKNEEVETIFIPLFFPFSIAFASIRAWKTNGLWRGKKYLTFFSLYLFSISLNNFPSIYMYVLC